VTQVIVLLPLLFFLSGIAGLVYQILWLRLLSLTFGVTVYAATTVLAAFMAGLGAGSALGGRLAERVSNPLLYFGVAELLVGVSALATPFALTAATDLYAGLHPSIDVTPALLTAVRFLCSLVVLLVPTTLMGASLPLLTRATVDDETHAGRQVGVLYACNTAGAIVGALAAGFYMIGAVGIAASFKIAAAVNGVVGGTAVAVSLGRPRVSAPALESATEVPADANAVYDDRTRTAVLIVFWISGLTALALEVIWFRLLVLILPATTYAFTTMLASVLGGIAVGSAAIVPFMRRHRHWPAVLGKFQMGVGAAAVASMYALAVTYIAGWRTRDMIQASVLSIVPAALLMGAAFPIGVRIWTAVGRGRTGAAARVGTLYAINVAGAILGSILAGFLLLPFLGSRASLLAVAGLQVATGCALILMTTSGPRRTAIRPIAIGTGIWILAAALIPDPFAMALTRRHPRGERVLWKEEGLQTTVSVNEGPTGQRVMYLNGLHQANDTPEMIAVHRMIGHLPMLLHPSPSRVLVVGLGGGATAGAVAHHGAAVDLVELSSSVVRGAQWFRHINDDVVQRSNVDLRVDDGRSHLLLSGRQYDVITADIIQPIHAGAGSLYSVEYFQLARRALRPGGLMLQWVGHREETHYKLIVRTFMRVFPNATVWVDGTLLVGTLAPLEIRPDLLTQKLTNPELRKAVSSVGIVDAESVLRLYTAGPDEIMRFVGQGPELTDDRPLLEYHRSLPPETRRVDLSTLRGDVSRILQDDGGPAGGAAP
jgi:spermidine synthase